MDWRKCRLRVHAIRVPLRKCKTVGLKYESDWLGGTFKVVTIYHPGYEDWVPNSASVRMVRVADK